MSREVTLTRTLVQLADAIVDDFDLVDLLTLLSERCVEILDVDAAGIMLVSAGGDLRPIASSSDAMRVLEVFEEEANEGPCPDCYRTGEPVINMDLAEAGGRWPRFAPKAITAGFHSVHALPMRVHGRAIGALNLFRSDHGLLGDADISVAQALADVATISIVAQRAAADAQAVNAQLQEALNSRIVIEQAKGVVAQARGVELQFAFGLLRSYAREHNLKLGDVANGVITRTIRPESLTPRPPSRGRGRTQ